MELKLKRNVGDIDRIIRVTLGVVLIYLAIFIPFSLSQTWQWILGIAGIVSIVEGVLGY